MKNPQSMYWTRKGFVLCEPFPEVPKETVKVGGIALQAKRTGVVKLQVLLNDKPEDTPSYAFVRAADADQPWAKEVFDIDGHKTIVVPEDRVVARHRIYERDLLDGLVDLDDLAP
jgi:hypothetical protein